MSNEQREVRLQKLEQLRKEGCEPFYTGEFTRDEILTIRERCKGIEPENDENLKIHVFQKNASVAGRISAIRVHGKASFFDIEDDSDKIQVYVKSKITPQASKIFQFLDIGDIVGVQGPIFKTKTGELTILANDLKVLTKSLQPMPEKWHGLKDVEVRYRRRYLDLIANKEVKEVFKMRAKIIDAIREFMQMRGFLEVETPMMHPIPGGATAKPFITHHNSLDMDLFLRIAPELYLKKLLVGGFEKIFEINRNFRNEGISTKHNPEFTMMEVYQAYGDYNTMRSLTQNLIKYVIEKVDNNFTRKYQDVNLDFNGDWNVETYLDLFKKNTGGLDWFDFDKVIDYAKKVGVETKDKPPYKIANDVFEKVVEPKLIDPIFVVDYPLEITPLAMKKRGDPRLCERFELFVCGMELANAFTELNDPIDQRKRFEKQIVDKEEGMARLDEDFLFSLEYGMPPAGGLGVGIDRLVMILTNSSSIRDVILFPLLKEEEIEPRITRKNE